MARRQKDNLISMPDSDASRLPRPASPTVSDQEIAYRAYEIYERRGGAPGEALADWLQAERELLTASPARRHA